MKEPVKIDREALQELSLDSLIDIILLQYEQLSIIMATSKNYKAFLARLDREPNLTYLKDEYSNII